MTASTLVLLPGMDGSGLLFDPFVAALAPLSGLSMQILRYPRDEPMGYDQLQELVERALPNDGRFVLLGESFSGPIAVALAAARPQRVAGVILCCSFVRSPRAALRPLSALAGWLAGAGIPPWAASRVLFGQHATAPSRERLRQALRGVTSATWRARIQAIATVDASAAFASISAPLLYLQAAQDLLVPRSVADSLLGMQPSMELAAVAGPHALLQALPLECASIVARFLAANA